MSIQKFCIYFSPCFYRIFVTHYILCFNCQKPHNPLLLWVFPGFLKNEMKNEKQSKTA